MDISIVMKRNDNDFNDIYSAGMSSAMSLEIMPRKKTCIVKIFPTSILNLISVRESRIEARVLTSKRLIT